MELLCCQKISSEKKTSETLYICEPEQKLFNKQKLLFMLIRINKEQLKHIKTHKCLFLAIQNSGFIRSKEQILKLQIAAS